MSMEITGEMIVECDECGKHIKIDSTNLDTDIGSYERNMGAEDELSGKVELECDKCGNHIEVDVSAWEYPVNCLNDTETRITGGKLIEGFSIGIVEERPDEDDF